MVKTLEAKRALNRLESLEILVRRGSLRLNASWPSRWTSSWRWKRSSCRARLWDIGNGMRWHEICQSEPQKQLQLGAFWSYFIAISIDFSPISLEEGATGSGLRAPRGAESGGEAEPRGAERVGAWRRAGAAGLEEKAQRLAAWHGLKGSLERELRASQRGSREPKSSCP